MLLPIRSDHLPRKRPTVNYAIIGVNVALFILWELTPAQMLEQWVLASYGPKLYQFLTYAFLHAGWAHVLGNMLFLYVFGNSVNDKMGHIPYLLFYLGACVFTAVCYSLFNDAPLVGASGAVAAVTSAYLVLLPRSKIQMLYWLFILIGTFEVPAVLVIVVKMILLDNIISPHLAGAQQNIAYTAHLAGYGFGFVVLLVLLWIRALPRDQFDILALWRRALQRWRFSRVVASDIRHTGTGPIRTSRPIKAPTVEQTEESAVQEDKIWQLRQQINEALTRHDLTSATEYYLEALSQQGQFVLSDGEQLDVSNQLMAQKMYPEAGQAYEKYLEHYPSSLQIEQVQLLLGVIYARYMDGLDRARELLGAAGKKLTDSSQLALCKEELVRLEQ